MHIGNNYYTILYVLAVSVYPCFWKMPYQRIAVSVSAYPYPVSVQRRAPIQIPQAVSERGPPNVSHSRYNNPVSTQ
jgi:hypothetical protein